MAVEPLIEPDDPLPMVPEPEPVPDPMLPVAPGDDEVPLEPDVPVPLIEPDDPLPMVPEPELLPDPMLPVAPGDDEVPLELDPLVDWANTASGATATRATTAHANTFFIVDPPVECLGKAFHWSPEWVQLSCRALSPRGCPDGRALPPAGRGPGGKTRRVRLTASG
jgi:hypothetical protein